MIFFLLFMSSITILPTPTKIILNVILMLGEVADNTGIQSFKLTICQISGEVYDNYPHGKLYLTEVVQTQESSYNL